MRDDDDNYDNNDYIIYYYWRVQEIRSRSRIRTLNSLLTSSVDNFIKVQNFRHHLCMNNSPIESTGHTVSLHSNLYILLRGCDGSFYVSV